MSNKIPKQEKNQIISEKWLLPKALTVFLGTPLLACAILAGVQEGPKAWKNPDKKAIVSFSIATSMMIGLIVFSIWWAVEVYKDDYAFASHLVRKFIRQAMKDYPELKAYEKVLDDPQAMQSVATMVSNSIKPSDQLEILRIFHVLNENLENKYFTHEDRLALVKESYKELSKIMAKHMKRHPEFIQDVYAAMSRAHNTYVMPAQGIVR